jgi:hypothetical protein
VNIPTGRVSNAIEVMITATYRRDSQPVQIRLVGNGALPGGGGGSGSSLNIPSTVTAFALLGSAGVRCTASVPVNQQLQPRLPFFAAVTFNLHVTA